MAYGGLGSIQTRPPGSVFEPWAQKSTPESWLIPPLPIKTSVGTSLLSQLSSGCLLTLLILIVCSLEPDGLWRLLVT